MTDDDRPGSSGLSPQDQDTLAAWALDALEGAERDAVDERVRADPRWAAEAARWHDVLAARVAALPQETPRADLREDLLATVAVTEQAPTAPVRSLPAEAGEDRDPDAPSPGAPVMDLARERRRRRGPAVLLAAAALAVAIPLGISTMEAPSPQERSAEALQQVLDDGGRRSDVDLAGGGRLTVAVRPDRRAVVTAADLPGLPEGRGYQLWALDAEGVPSSLGMLAVAQGQALTEIPQVPQDASLAVTVEPTGGSPRPTTLPLGAVPVDA